MYTIVYISFNDIKYLISECRKKCIYCQQTGHRTQISSSVHTEAYILYCMYSTYDRRPSSEANPDKSCANKRRVC